MLSVSVVPPSQFHTQLLVEFPGIAIDNIEKRCYSQNKHFLPVLQKRLVLKLKGVHHMFSMAAGQWHATEVCEAGPSGLTPVPLVISARNTLLYVLETPIVKILLFYKAFTECLLFHQHFAQNVIDPLRDPE